MTDQKNILIVDDEPDILKVTVFRIKKAGYNVITAVDGQQGLETAKRETPDLIFLDFALPLMNGHEVCQRLKADEDLKKIPVILLTASVDKIKEHAENAGADDYLAKPFEPQDLLGKVEKFLG